jgi:hypothetical protein
MFQVAKDRLLHPKRPSFGTRKLSFCKAKHISFANHLQILGSQKPKNRDVQPHFPLFQHSNILLKKCKVLLCFVKNSAINDNIFLIDGCDCLPFWQSVSFCHQMQQIIDSLFVL